ncbi:unnamed protein product [Hyaloperonospora brassicae]|uniref:RxLR effector candidate protein n=1 Tax=Hyaloperonospora brassicae TaxID=162125 RepID=A0AAV0UN03_HYABA|nr:unnamed protein product [Hyaloperonospora brassicae]
MLATCVLLLQRTIESTTTSGVHKSAAARNVSAVSLRREEFTTVGPARVKPQDADVDVANDADGGQEERMFPTWASVVKGTHAMEEVERLSLPQARTSEILTPYAINEKADSVVTHGMAEPAAARDVMDKWLAISPTEGHEYLKSLVNAGQGGKLLEAFNQLRHDPSYRVRADMMQRALLEEDPVAWPLAAKLWLESRVSPAEYFHMMPFRPEGSAADVLGKGPHPPITYPTLDDWYNEVGKFRENLVFDDDQVVEVLLDSGRSEDVAHFLWQHQGLITRKERPSQQKLAMIVSRSADILDKLPLMWLTWSVSPKDVFYMMPISLDESFKRTIEEGSISNSVRDMLQTWVNYLYKYRAMGLDFSDDELFKLMGGSPQKMDAVNRMLRQTPKRLSGRTL